MLETLLTAIGRTRKGKSTKQLQEKLGWTKAQIRNALSRAKAKGLLEPVVPGVYRKKNLLCKLADCQKFPRPAPVSHLQDGGRGIVSATSPRVITHGLVHVTHSG